MHKVFHIASNEYFAARLYGCIVLHSIFNVTKKRGGRETFPDGSFINGGYLNDGSKLPQGESEVIITQSLFQ